jgi:drug/metabolite transporter (DMT)-like permease
MALGTADLRAGHAAADPRAGLGGCERADVGALVYSALFALCVAYTIWYVAVREIGSARTSVYSNLVPMVAMMTAVVFLDEPLSAGKLAGAAAVLVGVALTRIGRTRPLIPAEE